MRCSVSIRRFILSEQANMVWGHHLHVVGLIRRSGGKDEKNHSNFDEQPYKAIEFISDLGPSQHHQVVRSDLRYHHPERIRRRSRLWKLQHRWDLYEVPQASRLGTRMLRSV